MSRLRASSGNLLGKIIFITVVAESIDCESLTYYCVVKMSVKLSIFILLLKRFKAIKFTLALTAVAG